MAIYLNHHKLAFHINNKSIENIRIGKEFTELIEGEDFLRYKWLKVQTTTQRGDYLKLPLGTSMNFSFKRVWLSDFLNTWYFYTPGYVYYTDNHRLVNIWDSTNSVVVDSGDTSTIDVGDIITIESTPDLLLINGKTINRCNYVSGTVSLTNAVALEITSLTSSIYVDDVERYIPCQLLCDIPASLDGNSIARSKGECGMYDTVSGKFYGNIANVGTFSVEGLIEGVQYERYQWLCGRNGAYIDTNYKIKAIEDSFDIKFKWDGSIRNPSNNEQDILGYANVSNNQPYACSWINTLSAACVSTGYKLHTDWSFEPYDVSPYYEVNMKLSCDTSNFDTIINGITYTNSNNGLTSLTLDNCYLFNINVPGRQDISTRYFHGDISYFNINPNKVHMYPVKLIHDIPASADGNGIARSKGDCGMYDTVSGKFYGNIANLGTFSVSGLRENRDYLRYEWLMKYVEPSSSEANYTNKAYINTLVKLTDDTKVSTTVNNSDVCDGLLMGARDADIEGAFIGAGCADNYLNISRSTTGSLGTSTGTLAKVKNLGAKGDVIVNDTTYTSWSDVAISSSLDFYIFALNNNGNTMNKNHGAYQIQQSPGSMKIGRTTLSENNHNIVDLVPCKLLHSIPASDDANNIPRFKGECGMIDRVSGKFYGNVNSSGIFTVGELIQGVDFEVKDWLKGDGSAYIDTNIIVNVPSLYVKTSFTQLPDSLVDATPLFGSRDLDSGFNGSHVWFYTDKTLRLDVVSNGPRWVTANQDVNNLIIDVPSNKATLNGTDYVGEVSDYSAKNSIYTFRIFDLSQYNRSYYHSYHGQLSEFILKDSTHELDLVPCKLLHSIPASLDANGIARSSGECGMIDKISGKFYGNVNGTGTFATVDGLQPYAEYKCLNCHVPDGTTLPTGHVPYIALPQAIALDNEVMTMTYGGTYRDLVFYGDVIDGKQYMLISYYYDNTNLLYVQERLGINTTLSEISDSSMSVIFDFRNNIAKTGSKQFSIQGTGYLFSNINQATWSTPKKLRSIVITNKLYLVPCKLVKSIPASMDGNNVARSVGECGMWDKVNNKFYGNVSEYGTFTVSN